MKPSDLSKMTRQQLQDLARRKKIAVPSNLLKADLASKVGRELRKQEKRKAAGAKGKAKKNTSSRKKTVGEKAATPKAATKKAGGSRSTRATPGKKKAATAKASSKTKKTAVAGRTKAKTGTRSTVKAGATQSKKTAARSTSRKAVSATKKKTPSTRKTTGKATAKPKAASKTARAVAKKQAPRKPRAATAARKRPTPASGLHPPREVDEELAAKFILGPAAMQDESEREARMDLPAGYGDHRLVMMVRDPYWVYCYWELQPQYIEEALSRLGRPAHEVRWVLRMHPEGGRKGSGHFDTEIDTRARSWYMHLAPPGATFTAEIGILDGTGRYAAVARSNSVTLPMDRPSSNMDEQWMLSDEELHHHYAGMEFPHAEGMKPTGKGSLFDEGQSGRPVQTGGASEYRPPSFSKK
ncbi:DUF4912 domain-containing protein [Nitrospina gracilis]|uniref:DUF4912 domain-containing protein n=1 Tax=Nitrospina gracilis TaxID=35801 RepID=UPI001F3823DE|nr:DUF4912 domain-containing protein [Nitrospina gracilis]MCF8719533.1 hypothetical protein [Nitrospina gracilis Nb-211]